VNELLALALRRLASETTPGLVYWRRSEHNVCNTSACCNSRKVGRAETRRDKKSKSLLTPHYDMSLGFFISATHFMVYACLLLKLKTSAWKLIVRFESSACSCLCHGRLERGAEEYKAVVVRSGKNSSGLLQSSSAMSIKIGTSKD
jgi:hypothetical protein